MKSQYSGINSIYYHNFKEIRLPFQFDYDINLIIVTSGL